MYKLGSGVQERSICLRCLIRLGLRPRHRPLPHHQRSPQTIRYFTASRRLWQEQADLGNTDNDQHTTRESVLTYHPYDKGPIRRNVEKRLHFDPDGPGGLNVTWEPTVPPSKTPDLDKTFRHLSMKDRLGIDSLGQPAEVLILRERHKQRGRIRPDVEREYSEPSDESPAAAMSSSDMLDEMNAERGIIDTDQVCKNIDIAKGEWIKEFNLPREITGSLLATKYYGGFASKLYNGFTMSQLATYLERNAQMHSLDPLDLHNEFSSALYSRSCWSAGTTDLLQIRAPNILNNDGIGASVGRAFQETSEEHVSPKLSLINAILRHCWRLRPEENETSIGELDIQLQSIHLQLIVGHVRGILKQISETYGAKVEVSPQRQAIRVTSDYETCLDILKLIIHTTENIRSSLVNFPADFRPKLRSSNPLKEYEVIIQQIMQSTNTIIRGETATALNRELTIYYLGPDDDDLEDARRLIGQILRAAPTKDRKLLIPQIIKSSKDVLVPVDVGNGLSLTDRSQHWSRWCGRSVRAIDPKDQQKASTPALNTFNDPLNQKTIRPALKNFFATAVEKHEVAEKTRPHWKSNVTYWDSVTLGQVIFPAPRSKTEGVHAKPDSKKPGSQPRLNQGHREFVTRVPGVVGLLENIGLGNLATTTLNEEFLLIRLNPSIDNTVSVPFGALPDLEIRIAFDQISKTPTIRDVRLVLRAELDLLLLQNTMDLRFARRTCVYSRGGGLDPSIEQFIQDSHLDIRSGGRLRTPPGLTLSIPPHALGPILDGRSGDGFEHEQVEYTFTGLEHRNDMVFPFHKSGSWADLTYTIVEAGKLGGRRDELCLKQLRQLEKAKTDDDEDASEQKTDEISDDHYLSSLTQTTNALINMIEDPPQNGVVRPGYGVGSAQRDLHRAKAREENSQLSGRAKANFDRTKAGRVVPIEDLVRKVPGERVRRPRFDMRS